MASLTQVNNHQLDEPRPSSGRAATPRRYIIQQENRATGKNQSTSNCFNMQSPSPVPVPIPE